MLFKNKGSQNDCTKCRMIGLLPTAYTLVSTLLLHRLRLECEGFLDSDQARFHQIIILSEILSLNFKRKPHQLVKLAWRHSVAVQSLTFIYLKTSFLVYNVLRERSTTLQSTSHKYSINSAPRLAISLVLPLPPHHHFLPLYQCRCYILYCLAKLGSTIALVPAPRTAPLVDWAVADASVSVQSHPPRNQRSLP